MKMSFIRGIMAVVVLALVFSASLASAGSRSREMSGGPGQAPADSKLETDVQQTSVVASGGMLSNQEVNVGTIQTGGSVKGSSISTHVKGVSINAQAGMLSNQEVNYGSINIK